MIAYISALFPTKNRLSTLLIKVKACEKSVRRPGKAASLLGYQIFRTCQAIDLSPQFHKQIGLDKLIVRAKGINHPKYSVKPEYACLTRESATS
jgi:hypothetical protein